MPEIMQLRGRAAHNRSVAGYCDARGKRDLLKTAQDFDDEAKKAEDIKMQLG
jgi:hypothetical protein